MKNLVALQTLEFGRDVSNEEAPGITELRARIPDNILGHYDRLMARGKKGVVAVRNQTCTGCHMRVPLAVVMTLRHADDIQLCDNCSRYLYLRDEEEAPARTAPTKTRQSGRKRASPKASKNAGTSGSAGS